MKELSNKEAEAFERYLKNGSSKRSKRLTFKEGIVLTKPILEQVMKLSDDFLTPTERRFIIQGLYDKGYTGHNFLSDVQLLYTYVFSEDEQ